MASSYELLVHGKTITLDEMATAFPTMFGDRAPARLRSAGGAYSLVPWIFRACNISANAVISVPYTLYRGDTDTEVDWPFENTDETWFHWRSDIAQNMWGAAYWVILERQKELQWLNPATMDLEIDPKKGIIRFIQRVAGQITGSWAPEQIVYLPRFHPTRDWGPGISPIEVAIKDAELSYNITEYAAQFFSHGAIPAVLLKSDAPLRPQEQERIRTQWQKLYGSIRNAWRTAVLGRGIEPVVVGHAVKDLAMPELNEQASKNIAAAFEMSVTFLRGEAANYATAEQETVKYYIGTVQPKCLIRQGQLDMQLWRARNIRGVFDIKSVEPVQQYEAQKAAAYSDLMERVEAQAESGLLTRDRAVYLIEEMWTGIGYDKLKQIPDEEPEPEPAPIIQQIAQPPPNGGPPEPQNGGPPQQPQRSFPLQDTVAEVRAWRRYVKNRGLSAREFEIEHIPIETANKMAEFLHATPDIASALSMFDDMILHLEGKAADPLVALEDETDVEPETPIDVDRLLSPAISAWNAAMSDEAQGILDAEPV